MGLGNSPEAHHPTHKKGTDISIHSDSLAKAAQEYGSALNEIDALRLSVTALQEKVTQLTDSNTALSTTNEDLTATIAALKVTIAQLEARIEELDPTPPAYTNPKAVVVSDTQIDVSWTLVPGATGYLVGRNAAGAQTTPWSTTDPDDSTSRRFAYLTPATKYVLSVQALPDGPVETVEATTQAAPATPPPPPVADYEVPGLPVLGIGVNAEYLGGPQDDAHLTKLRALSQGSMWYRRGFGPSSGDPTATIKTFLRKMEQFNFKVVLRISLGDNPPAVTSAQYAQHARFLVQAAADEGWGPDRIIFELHNEYLTSESNIQHYVNMAKAAFPVMKSINPNYKLIGGSQNVYSESYPWSTSLDRAYALKLGDYMDGLSWHNYAPQGVHGRTNKMYEILTKYGQRNKLIVMTEFGASTRLSGGSDGTATGGTPEGGLTFDGQRLRVTEVLKDLGANHKDIKIVILYVDVDIPSRVANSPHEAYFGLMTNKKNADGTWTRVDKPVVGGVKALYRKV